MLPVRDMAVPIEQDVKEIASIFKRQFTKDPLHYKFRSVRIQKWDMELVEIAIKEADGYSHVVTLPQASWTWPALLRVSRDA